MAGRINQRYGRVEKEARRPAKRRRGLGIFLGVILKYLLVRKKSRLVSLIMVRVRLEKKRV